MSIDAIKQEPANLDDASRRQIMAFLFAMDDQKVPGYRVEMSRKIDDKNPANWMSLEELEKRLGLGEDRAH